MRYCSHCVLPDTRPFLKIESDGICNACHAHRQRPHIDWKSRERAFKSLVRWAKARKAPYDCVIPVSGGKDSTWQVVQCLKYGLHPLAVTWKTPGRSKLGAENLRNLISLGVDHIDFSINPQIEKIFILEALRSEGSPAIPMHLALFNIPLSIAVRYRTPLVIWGENSATEYGGKSPKHLGSEMNNQWIRHYGATAQTTADDWISSKLSRLDLTPYKGPSEKEVRQAGIRPVFLGYYFPWDPLRSLKVAEKNGFQVRKEGPKTGYYNYADIDDDFISIHHYIKWYKFGFTRTFDNLSLEIRNGRMTRQRAIQILKNRGEERPQEDIRAFCRFTGVTENTFDRILERFRNHRIWKRKKGRWTLRSFPR